MLRKILIALAVIIVVFVVVVAVQPADFRITRTATIAAPPEAIFQQVNDLGKWEAWSPWAKIDPKAKMTFTGPQAGVGASFSWAGNSEVGEGNNTIVESKPSEMVKFRLEFIRPMKATNATEFTFQPEGGKTVVTWTMTGRNGFMGKAFGLFVNCDKMVGGDFEKGFASMKAIVEAKPGT